MDSSNKFIQFIKNKDLANADIILRGGRYMNIIPEFIRRSETEQVIYAYDNLPESEYISYFLYGAIDYGMTDVILHILKHLNKSDEIHYYAESAMKRILLGEEDADLFVEAISIVGPKYYPEALVIAQENSDEKFIDYIVNLKEILIACALYGTLETFEYVLENTQVDPAYDGNKAIIFASNFDDVNILKRLQEYPGVDINATINETFNGYYLDEEATQYTDYSCLSNACIAGSDDVLKYLLEIANYSSLDLYRYISHTSDYDLLYKFLLNPDVDPSFSNNKIIKKLLDDIDEEGALDAIKIVAKDQRVIDTLDTLDTLDPSLKRRINKEVPGLFKFSLKSTIKKKLFPLLYNYDSKSQKVCDFFKPLDKSELEYVADIYNINKKLPRAQICIRLGIILESYVKNKQENIGKCNNNETSIGGDNIKDIPARRFFTYTQNGKVYCEDLEEFHDYIESGGNKNPFTGIDLESYIINNLKKEYKKLKMDVFNKYTETNTTLTYSSHLANLLSRLQYPRNDDWYKALSADEIIDFIKSFPGIYTELTDKSVRTLDEIRQTGIQELVKFIEDDTISPDKTTKKVLVTQMWNGYID